MKKAIIFIILFLIALALQIILMGGLQIGRGRPDFFLILLVLWAWYNGWKEGVISGFIIGILEDILFSPLWGVNAFTLCIVGFLVGEIREKVYEENLILLLIIMSSATIINGFLLLFLSSVFHIFSFSQAHLTFLILLTSLYNSLLILPIFIIKEGLRKSG
ncbi:MAG: rod shape-determining protein MreD [Candidatus Aerophobetes bacterium]|nr:rod shape-determining protein MreD [Candidatus Aerophobetes bacterium]